MSNILSAVKLSSWLQFPRGQMRTGFGLTKHTHTHTQDRRFKRKGMQLKTTLPVSPVCREQSLPVEPQYSDKPGTSAYLNMEVTTTHKPHLLDRSGQFPCSAVFPLTETRGRDQSIEVSSEAGL